MHDRQEYTDASIDASLDMVADFMEETFEALDVGNDTEIDLDFRDDHISGRVEGDDEDIALLIGRRGQTLDAVQFLANAVTLSRIEGGVHVRLDAQGYRKRREKQLRRDADRAVAEVVRSGRTIELDPMTSSERKAIHTYLKDRDDVATQSSGREPNRRLAISPLD